MKTRLRKLLKNDGLQSVFASLLCILLGLFIGYIVLLCINPEGAWKSILDLTKNFLGYTKKALILKNLGNTLVKTAPLILCSLSILFCYKVGLFNIGAAGQYCAGIALSLYGAIALGLPWWACLLLAVVAGALLGCISGLLKAYCNVNEVISGIMLNWIALYCTNVLLTAVKEPTSPYTKGLPKTAIMPSLGLEKLFNNNKSVTIALLIAVLLAVLVWVVLEKTRFGYELKATGFNKNAAKYAGMPEKWNIVIALVIGGALAGCGAGLFYLTGIEQWSCSSSSVPNMGFNGIAAAFLGGLNPVGSIFSSFFIQHITDGGMHVDTNLYSSEISQLISAIIIYLCGFVLFTKYAFNRILQRKEEKERQAKAAADDAAKKPEGGDAK